MTNKGTKYSLLAAGTLLCGAAAWLPAYSAGPAPFWTTLTPVPSIGGGVEGMSVAQVGGHIIAALGLDRGAGDTRTLRIYDIAGDSWSFGADAPGNSSEGAGVSHGGLFYTLGGRQFGVRADIWSYNPDTDAWDATLAPMKQGRAGLAAAVVGNAIYAIGGRQSPGGPCSGMPLASVERYDIDTDTWSNVAPLPFPRSDLAAAVVGGKIYVFGGCVGYMGGFLNNVDVYDPTTDTWQAVATTMPTPRAGLYSVAVKGETVYVIGGWNGPYPGLDTNEAYSVSKNAWTTSVPMPTARGEAGAVGHGGRIYVVGGSRPAFGAAVAVNEAFKP